MRRRRSNAILVLILAAGILARPLGAQSGLVLEGALELLVPTGARAIGMGQAAVADAAGTESVGWNPALVARRTKREVGIHFAQSLFAETDLTLGVLLPLAPVGVVAVNGRLIDYGEQPAGSDPSGPTGLLATRTTVAGATFGAPLGRVAVGLSFKLFRQTYACTGECPNLPLGSASTSAIDLGIEGGDTVRSRVIRFGVAIRNVGRSLQVKDAPQADPLPTRLDAGAALSQRVGAESAELELLTSAGIVTRVSGGGGTPGVRGGAELSYQRKYHLRGGYVLYGPTGSGASIGLGLQTGKLHVDIARFLSDLSAQAGEPPTYVSLRYVF